MMLQTMHATAQAQASVTLLSVPPVSHAADLALLSAPELERAGRFVFERDRAAFVTARAALRRLLSAETGIDAATLPLGIDTRGRPFLDASGHDALDFNLSHSGALAAVAISRGGRVGVDVEWHDLSRSLRDLVPQVMGAQETALLRTLDGDEFARCFLACWTRKEAVVKGIGVGIAFPLQTIDVPGAGTDSPVRVQTSHAAVWSVCTSEPVTGFTLSVALAGESTQLHADQAFCHGHERLGRAQIA